MERFNYLAKYDILYAKGFYMTKLPDDFLKNMSKLLGDAYTDYLSSYQETKAQGFRLNTLKIKRDEFLDKYSSLLSESEFSPILWCKNGFHFDAIPLLSKSPLYHAGLFYIQEPSAMSPVEFMGISPGMNVLDLCAAPGGKSVQIATKLQGEGLLISNDISLKRTKAILRNIEMSGITNAMITNASPEELVPTFTNYFDRILVDAPCSGEGMFRKDPDLIKSYHQVLPQMPSLQKGILQEASEMLCMGGRLVYSTCTFNLEENEKIILDFLQSNPHFKMIDPFKEYPEAADYDFEPGKIGVLAFRLFPHKLKGEGHFVSILEKTSSTDKESVSDIPIRKNQLIAIANENCDIDFSTTNKKTKHKKTVAKKTNKSENPFISKEMAMDLFDQFQKDHINKPISFKNIVLSDFSLYSEHFTVASKGFRILRNGLYLGDIKNGNFVPSAPFILSLKKSDFKRWISMELNDPNLVKFLKSETLFLDTADGLYFVGVDDYPLGYVKVKDKVAKNYYNKNWRLQ